MPALFKYAILMLAALASVAGFAELRWNRRTGHMRALLGSGSRPNAGGVHHEADVAALPAPVARYFRAVLSDRQRVVTHAHVAWTGQFNMGSPGADNWVPFTAEQDFVPGAPGMVWDARMRMAPGLTVRVRDGLVDGEGSMYGAVLGLIPVVDKKGSPEMATASLQRYLAEAVWLPTALLPTQGVRWTAVDDSRALATIRAGLVEASVEFRFGDDGLVAAMVVPDRLFDDGKRAPERHPWRGRILRYTTVDGMRVPEEAVVEWLMPAGPYAYWRGTPTAIEYSYDP